MVERYGADAASRQLLGISILERVAKRGTGATRCRVPYKVRMYMLNSGVVRAEPLKFKDSTACFSKLRNLSTSTMPLFWTFSRRKVCETL